LIPAERQKIIDTVIAEPNTFLHSKEGVNLFCNALDLMEVKERKQLLKEFKGKVKDLLTAQNSFFHIVLMKVCTTVDDSVLIKKSILNVTQPNNKNKR
jgi:hypothetical protein